MTKIKLSALACAILVGGGQLVAEDVNNTIDLKDYGSVDINNETRIIKGNTSKRYINVDNNEDLIFDVSSIMIQGHIDIINNSNVTFNTGLMMNNSRLYINDSTAVFNSPILEMQGVLIGESLSLNNSTLDIKGIVEFTGTDVLINQGSTATINGTLTVNDSGTIEFVDGEFVVNDGGTKIDKSNLKVVGEANFDNSDTELNNSSIVNFKDKLTLFDSAMLLKNSSSLNVGGVADFLKDSALIVKDDSNATINGALGVYDSGTIEFVDGEYVAIHGGIKIDKSNLKVVGEANFDNSVAELNNSSNANFEDSLVLFDGSAMLLKNSSSLDVGGVADFDEDSALIVQNGSKVMFNDNFTMKNGAKPIIEQDNDFSGGALSLDNSTLDIKGRAEFNTIDVLINQGSTATINNLEGYNSKIYVVNDSKLEINKDAGFHSKTHLMVKDNSTAKIDNLTGYVSEIYVVNDSELEIDNDAEFYNKTRLIVEDNSSAKIDNLTVNSASVIYVVNDSELEINKDAFFYGTNLIVEDDSNTTINGALSVKDSGSIEFVDGEYVVNYDGIKIDKSNLNVEGEVNFNNVDTELNNSSIVNFKDKLTLFDSTMLLKNSSTLNVGGVADFTNSALIIKDDSNTTINGTLSVKDSGTIEFVDGEFVVNDGGTKIDKSNLKVVGEANFDNSDTELNNSSIVNFKDKLTLFDSAMLLKNSSSLNVGGVADFMDSALVVQNGSKVLFNDKFAMRNRDEKSIIILDNGSEINIKGDFENHGIIYYGASADSAPKITVDGKATLKDTTEIGIYATSGDISNLNQLVFLESKGAIENQATDDNIYAMYFDPNNEEANEEGLVKYDQNIIDAVLNLSKDGKKLLVQILMAGDMQNRPINEKIDFIAKSTQAAGVNLTAQDLDIITSLFTIGDAKGNGAVATEGIKLAEQAKQGNQEAAQIISKTAQSIQKNSQDSITATSNLINTFNLATKNEVGKRISNVTTRSNVSQLANFIESLEGQKFADASSGVLLSMMADEMAAYQNSFYLNALGVKGDFKDGTNPKIYGAILGYDRMIDDLLIGGYFSYTNSETENIELDSNIYELGLYSRYFLDNNEFDFNIAGGYGKNDLSYTQNIFGINKILQSNFNSSYIALGLDYGYRFAINDNASIKPYIGADYLYSKTQNYTLKDETGKDFQKVQSNTVKNLKANLGLEMVKNFDEISIYADAKIKRDLINDEGFTRSSFAGSSAGFNIKGSDKKHTNFAIDTGIVYNATKNLSINLNLGADVNSDDKIYSTSFGAAYKF